MSQTNQVHNQTHSHDARIAQLDVFDMPVFAQGNPSMGAGVQQRGYGTPGPPSAQCWSWLWVQGLTWAGLSRENREAGRHGRRAFPVGKDLAKAAMQPVDLPLYRWRTQEPMDRLLVAGPVLRHDPDELEGMIRGQLQQRSPGLRDLSLFLRYPSGPVLGQKMDCLDPVS